MALNSLMLIMAVIELVVSIWSAALCCTVVCSCCHKTGSTRLSPQANSGQAYYPQQPMAMFPAVETGAYSSTQQPAAQRELAGCKCSLTSSVEHLELKIIL